MVSSQYPENLKAGDLLTFSDPCPYVPGRISSYEVIPFSRYFSQYETMLLFGWRRSGNILYRYRCEGCSLCIPLRLPLPRPNHDGPTPDKRRRRIEKANADIQVSIVKATFSEEHFDLYKKYCVSRHGENGDIDERSYENFLFSGMSVISEYRDKAGKLCAIGFLDILPDGVSSVYFAFDPLEGRRSLGRFSVFAESRVAAVMGKTYYYLGFWVPYSRKMDYKADFPPFELAVYPYGEGVQSPSPEWIGFSCKADALKHLAASPLYLQGTPETP